MLLTNFSLDILLYISANLNIHILSKLLLHCKEVYDNRYAFLKNNPYLHKYSLFDNTTSVYHVVFYSNTLPDIKRRCDHKKLYAITNIVSYYVVNNVITRDVAEVYLLTIYARAILDTPYLNFTKNTRLKLCCKIFKFIFQYDWEYLNINLYDLFSIIHCIVYKRYNDLYGILYHIQTHKSLMPLKTLHILINYKDDIDNTILAINKDYDNILLLKYVILFILYKYIENIHHHIIEMGFERLIPIIIQKCTEIKSLISDNKKIPNNFKLMFLKKLNNVNDIFT